MQTKSIDVLIEKGEDGFDARFVLSATTPDRVKDTIAAAAYKPYLGKELIALWAHDHTQPVGVWKNLRMQGTKLIGDLKLASIALGDMIKELMAAGVPLGASIGFRGKGSENDFGGIHFEAIDLLETSIVAVPMHPSAMQIAKSYGYDLGLTLKQVAPDRQMPKAESDVMKKATSAVAAAQLAISMKRITK